MPAPFFKIPRLLILDEATSALDYDTERQVSSNLQKWARGRTVFLITHRLNTIQHSDQILVMDQGSAVELGTHAELMEIQGRYFTPLPSTIQRSRLGFSLPSVEGLPQAKLSC